MNSSHLTEKQLLSKLQPLLTNTGLLGIDDDAVAIPLTNNSKDACLLVKIDGMAEKSDFFVQGGMTWSDFGRKLVVINFSDMAAKGIIPQYFMSSLSLPPSFMEINVDALINGLSNGCKEFNTPYLGGDIGTSEELVADGVAIGIGSKTQLIRRDGAQIGDLVCVTGEFGWTGLAYFIAFPPALSSSYNPPKHLLQRAFEKVIHPMPRIHEGNFLGMNRLLYGITACIDSSDGLSRSLYLLAELAHVQIDITNIPIAKELVNCQIPQDALTQWVFNAGEEYELVFTINKKNYQSFVANCPFPFQKIGEVKSGNGVQFSGQKLSTKSWDSLSGFH